MKYASLQAAITHAFAEEGRLDDNGNPIVAVGKIYDTYEEYQASKGSKNKVTDILSRMTVVENQETFICQCCGHELTEDYCLRTKGYCYLCDPNISVDELLSDKPI